MYFGVQKVWKYGRENQESDITAPPPSSPSHQSFTHSWHHHNNVSQRQFTWHRVFPVPFFHPSVQSRTPTSTWLLSSDWQDNNKNQKTKAVSLGREDVMTQYELCSTCGPGPSQTLDDSKIQTKAKKKNNTVLWLRFLHVFVIKCSLCCLLSFSFCLVEKKKKRDDNMVGWDLVHRIIKLQLQTFQRIYNRRLNWRVSCWNKYKI